MGHETPIFVVFRRPQKEGVQLSSLEVTRGGFNYAPVSIYIYIYIMCDVEFKLGLKIAFFVSKLGPSFLICHFFSKIVFFLQGECDFQTNRKKNKTKITILLSQDLDQVCHFPSSKYRSSQNNYPNDCLRIFFGSGSVTDYQITSPDFFSVRLVTL